MELISKEITNKNWKDSIELKIWKKRKSTLWRQICIPFLKFDFWTSSSAEYQGRGIRAAAVNVFIEEIRRNYKRYEKEKKDSQQRSSCW